MSNTPLNSEFPDDTALMTNEDYMNFIDEEWDQYFAGVRNEDADEPKAENDAVPSTGIINTKPQQNEENGAIYAIVKVWIDDDIAQCTTDYVHVTDAGIYAPIPQPNSADSAAVENMDPAKDEDEIKHGKLVPRSACVQYAEDWACCTCEWQEAKNDPEKFAPSDTKGPRVIECEMEALADDDNGYRLLRISMKTLKRGVPSRIELWAKRIVGKGEMTQLTSGEEDYVWDEEQKRLK